MFNFFISNLDSISSISLNLVLIRGMLCTILFECFFKMLTQCYGNYLLCVVFLRMHFIQFYKNSYNDMTIGYIYVWIGVTMG
jgi:hypothetical protein